MSFAALDLQSSSASTVDSGASLTTVGDESGASTTTNVPSVTPVVKFGVSYSATDQRIVTTKRRVYLSNIESLYFYILEGGGGWGESPDTGEDFVVQYSTDN